MQDDLPTDVGGDAREREGREGDVTPRLVHLADMHDLRVAQGDPDIRGWSVRTAQGEKVGVVSDLVVDTHLMKVRYVEARIDREVLNAGSDRHVLIPIESARLDEARDDVFLNAAVVDPRELPPYDRSMLLTEGGLPVHHDASSGLHAEEQFFGQRRRGREHVSYLALVDDRGRPPNELP